MEISNLGISLEKHYEGLHDGDLTKIGLQPKMCPAGIWTVGYGHALQDPKSGRFLKGPADKSQAYALYSNLTETEACELLGQDNKLRERQVDLLGLKFAQNQFDALVSFVCNLGIYSLEKSSLLRRIRAKDSAENIRTAFAMWNRCNGKELPGLTLRRKSEAELFITGKLLF